MRRGGMGPSRDCAAQKWQEAIAVLQVRAAELRLEAARYDQANPAMPSHDREHREWRSNFDDKRELADELQRLTDWLRENPGLPERAPEQAAA